jgi:hypothetical protein
VQTINPPPREAALERLREERIHREELCTVARGDRSFVPLSPMDDLFFESEGRAGRAHCEDHATGNYARSAARKIFCEWL